MSLIKITPTTLNEIARECKQIWQDSALVRGLDSQQFVTLSYIRAIEARLKVKFEYELPRHLEPVREDD